MRSFVYLCVDLLYIVLPRAAVSQEGKAMKSWKMRLFLALIALAMVLAVSVPAIADITVQCNVDDEGYCDKSVSYNSDEEERADPDLQEMNVDEPVVQAP